MMVTAWLGDCLQEDHYPIVSAPTPFLIGLPDMDSIAEYSAHGGTAQVSFLEVPATHGTRADGRFIDAEDLQEDEPIRVWVRVSAQPQLSSVTMTSGLLGCRLLLSLTRCVDCMPAALSLVGMVCAIVCV
jgi:hypothetical protein